MVPKGMDSGAVNPVEVKVDMKKASLLPVLIQKTKGSPFPLIEIFGLLFPKLSSPSVTEIGVEAINWARHSDPMRKIDKVKIRLNLKRLRSFDMTWEFERTR
jgi:hypothetical protein